MSPAPTRVGLIFGGASGEHAVSVRSAATIAGALRGGDNRQRYSLHCFYIDRQGRWHGSELAEAVLAQGLPAFSEQLAAVEQLTAEEQLAAAPSRRGFSGFPSGALDVEVWLPVLHGPNGEDGTIQGLFSLMQVPYVGSGVLGSAVGMDKLAMKAAFAAADLPQVAHMAVDASELSGEWGPTEPLLGRIESQLGYPCFVKPANLGSSVGISKASNRAELLRGLTAAALLDPRLVVERGVNARELECAVRGGGHQPLLTSVLGEIRFDADWYDYDTKYSEGKSHVLIPAPVSEAVAERARALAIQACRAVGAMGLARVDFFYAEATGDLWVNEINTFPGFTSQSMYPMLWAASGLPLDALVRELIEGARQWHRQIQGGGTTR
jgi:D-alanine-D-alanine ligase